MKEIRNYQLTKKERRSVNANKHYDNRGNVKEVKS
jgi:hypothetical protein